MQVCQWKNELLDGSTGTSERFSRKKRRREDHEIREAKLHETIGQLTVELDWMKRLSNRFSVKFEIFYF
jgi:hypothetical protein